MNVQRFNFDQEACNTYVVGEPGQPCLLIDFGGNPGGRVVSYCAKHHGFLAGVLLTHGHYDHIAGLANYEPDPNTRIVIHPEDEPFLYDPHLNCSDSLFGQEFILERELPLYLCEDEDEILLGARQGFDPEGNPAPIGGYLVRVLRTPFHTGGSVCFYLPEEKVLFSGDTLFHGGVGRMDLPHAKPRLWRDSLRKLTKLPPETKVYPGHGPATTLGDELRYNPYLQGLQ